MYKGERARRKCLKRTDKKKPKKSFPCKFIEYNRKQLNLQIKPDVTVATICFLLRVPLCGDIGDCLSLCTAHHISLASSFRHSFDARTDRQSRKWGKNDQFHGPVDTNAYLYTVPISRGPCSPLSHPAMPAEGSFFARQKFG